MSRSTSNMRKKGTALVFRKGVAEAEDENGKVIPNVYQVQSSSDKFLIYTIDMKDKKAHASTCLGFRYNGNCSHIQAVNTFVRLKKKAKESRKK